MQLSQILLLFYILTLTSLLISLIINLIKNTNPLITLTITAFTAIINFTLFTFICNCDKDKENISFSKIPYFNIAIGSIIYSILITSIAGYIIIPLSI